MPLAAVSDPFESVDREPQPEFEENVLLERINTAYYKDIIDWFCNHVLSYTTPHRVLEVGCGTGHVLDYFCRLADDQVEGFGVDRSGFLAERADRRFPRLKIQEADGRKLPFENDFFDICFIATVLVHADEPDKIVQEMSRVVRPGGLVVLLDQDFETAVLFPGEEQLTRRVLNAANDFWNDGWIGRRLPSLLSKAGLETINFSAKVRIDREFDKDFFRRVRDWIIQDGFPAADAEKWFDELCAAADRNFVFSRNFYCAIGIGQ